VTCEVGLSRSVRAFHIMPGLPGPEGQLHDHDYRIEIVVEREQLDSRGMVCDLDVLEAALTQLTSAGGEALAVRVWETPVAFGGYHARC
jgi:6-pyruvoyl-tetrahydropterin synthase